MPERGPEDAAAAMFIYKSDERVQAAWDAAEDVERRDRESGNRVLTEQGRGQSSNSFLRLERHRSKQSFLAALARWSHPRKQFALIYSHGADTAWGAVGIIPSIAAPGDQVITWQELAEALGDGVDCLWLIGCRCSDAANVWGDRPVRGWMLSCSGERDFGPLVEQFHLEISLASIRSPAVVLHTLQSQFPALADAVHVLRRENGVGVRCARRLLRSRRPRRTRNCCRTFFPELMSRTTRADAETGHDHRHRSEA